MTQFLPPNLLALFQARPPIPYMPPLDLKKRKQPPYLGIAAYTNAFEDPKDTPPPQPPQPDTKETRRKRKCEEKDALNKQRIAEQLEKWDPRENPNATSDAYKTLFVARMSYDTSERQLKRELEEYGPIKKVRVIKDEEGKLRGYAFVEFEKEKDMRSAYKLADGKKIDGRRVLVDVERGRTVKGWKPRRFGGGLGSSRAPRAPGTKPHEASGRTSEYSDLRRSGSESDYHRRDSSRDQDRGHRDRGGDRDRGRDNRRSFDRDRGDYDRDGYKGRSDRGSDRSRDSYRDRDYDKERFRK